jgi:aldose 1-epimerase
MRIPPSRQQYEIRHGRQTAVVVEVGGGVWKYRVGERAVQDPYPLGAMRDGAHGTPLMPWPDRLADGQCRFDGVDYQLAIT